VGEQNIVNEAFLDAYSSEQYSQEVNTDLTEHTRITHIIFKSEIILDLSEPLVLDYQS
jgi:hypothetical protein